MLFHTWVFVAFFAVVYALYLPLRRTRWRSLWLLAASYFFYGAWSPAYLLLIAFTTVQDYLAVTMMSRSRRRGMWLAISIVNNLVLLGFFKYAGFLTDSLNDLLAWVEIAWRCPPPGALLNVLAGLLNAALAGAGLDWRVGISGARVVLPVGISFFIFQSMSYTIDYYRGLVDRERSLIRYAAFVSLFPQLVAGPIERARNLLGQLHEPRPVTRQHVTDGLSMFLVGLFKKVAIADYLALYVDKVYAQPGAFDAPALLLATFAFGWQIYCDFSGYTDMARGVARMMGYDLMLNFNNPYLADSLRDFWSRWHISLSTWFRDYVYIPLGGNRKGEANTYRNMFLTMVISGLWHGAAWTFIIWGAVHAFGRVLTRELERTTFYSKRVPRIVKQLLVFVIVTLAWVFFRAGSLADARLIFKRIAAFELSDPRFPLLALALCLGLWAYQFLYESRLRRVLEWPPVKIALAVGMILYLVFVPTASKQAFIYFQF